ncbi:MAG: ABC transporter substrate-binding protein [Candidatus Dadabacteria bacterium]|nr:ABC transporter substrate-binding protein [Candidatus Dadabacteria bacterium]MYA48030.1 ABC transporter substrate-binding protein [Candidatus Dadabacteria bacterium]MYG82701.1 ABC transporter substrate-binding protein [Candidatus Dadabacteria bacterium]MYK49097.1 ABC transporter substrate-binding protein [Candidatus Dadabacteria bacterium]
MKRLIILGSVLLLVSMGIFSSGCIGGDDEAKVDCEEVFCIGTLLAEGEDFNMPLIEAVGLAKDDINKAGGNIEIISGNSFQAGAGEAVASATQLLEMGVRGIVGPSYSSDSVAVHPFLSDNQIVAISPSATSPTLTTMNKELVDGGDQNFFFRVSPSDLFQAPILARQTQGKTIIVNRDDAWGNPLAEHVREEIMSDGRQVEVVSYSSDPVSSAADVVSDVEAAVGRIPDVESIVLFVFSEGGEIVRGLLDSSVIPEEVGYYVGDGLVFTSGLFPHVDRENGEIEGFKQVISTPPPGKRLEEFKERFNFSDFTAHVYDAVVILRLAALSAGSNDPSVYVSKIRDVTREGTKCHSYATCAAALTDETMINDDIDYEGLSGPVDLDENGDIQDGLYAVDTYDAQGVAQRIYLNFQGEEQ